MKPFWLALLAITVLLAGCTPIVPANVQPDSPLARGAFLSPLPHPGGTRGIVLPPDEERIVVARGGPHASNV